MDIKDLNKHQLILLTLLITFVVSIATGIITVSLMQQVPKTVPQTINNVIQRTIEKVTTVPATTTPATTDTKATTTFGDGDVMVSIYSLDTAPTVTTQTPGTITPTVTEPKALGQGVIISDVGLVLVDTTILTDKDVYKVVLGKTDFDATIIKKFGNGFAILKITEKKAVKAEDKPNATPKIDNNQ